MSDKTLHRVDRHIAVRMRDRRLALGMSQHTLANLLGVTFQQIYKYESEVNRISVSRLLDVARALDTGLDYFLEGLEGYPEMDATVRPAAVSTFVADDESLAFTKLLPLMPRNVRRHMLAMAQAIAGMQSVKR